MKISWLSKISSSKLFCTLSNGCIILPELYELKECVKNDTLYIKILLTYDGFSTE